MARSDVHIINTRGWNVSRTAYLIDCTCGEHLAATAQRYAEDAYSAHILDEIRANRAADKAVI